MGLGRSAATRRASSIRSASDRRLEPARRRSRPEGSRPSRRGRLAGVPRALRHPGGDVLPLTRDTRGCSTRPPRRPAARRLLDQRRRRPDHRRRRPARRSTRPGRRRGPRRLQGNRCRPTIPYWTHPKVPRDAAHRRRHQPAQPPRPASSRTSRWLKAPGESPFDKPGRRQERGTDRGGLLMADGSIAAKIACADVCASPPRAAPGGCVVVPRHHVEMRPRHVVGHEP